MKKDFRKFCQYYGASLVLVVLLTVAVFNLWQQLRVYEQRHIQHLVHQEATAIEGRLTQAVSMRILSLELMAERWKVAGGIPRSLWEKDATRHIEAFSGYQAIARTDPSFQVQWIVAHSGNKSAHSPGPADEPHSRVSVPIDPSQHPAPLTYTLILTQDRKGFLAYTPLFVQDRASAAPIERFDGFIVGAFQFQSLFDSILPVSPHYRVQIFDRNGLIYSQRDIPTTVQPETVVVQAYGTNWQIKIFPTPALIATDRSPLPTVVLLGGLVNTWTLALVVYLRQRSSRQTQQVQQMNHQLKEEIAHRHQVEASLRESEERWQLALRGNNDGIWDWNVQTNEVFFSRRWKEMLGFEDHEIQNDVNEWSKRVHPEDLSWVTRVILDHFAGKTPFYITEHRVQCKDGSYKWVLDRGQALWDDAGNAIRMVGSHTDITDRKQAELSLQKSEAKYHRLVDHISAGFVVHAPDTHILQGNGTACELLGLSMENLLGKGAIDPAWCFVREDGTPMPLEEYPVNRVLRTQVPLRNYVLGINRSDQSRVWVLVNAFPEFDASHHLAQIVVTFIDISKLKQAEADLRETAEVMKNAISGISKLDIQGHYCYVNKAYADLTGYSPEEMIGMSWQQTVHPDDLGFLEVAYQQMVQDGKVEIEARGIRKDGSSFYKQLVLVATCNEQGQLIGHYCFVKDITDRKQAEKALEKELLRSKALFNTSMDGVVVMDYQGNVVQASPSFAQMLGYPGEALLKLNVADWDARWTREELRQMIANNVLPALFETRHRRQDQSLYDVEISCSRVEIDGESLYFMICRDISDRKQIEAERQQSAIALRQSEATKQAIIEAIPDLLIRMRSDGSYVDFISDSRFNLVNPTSVRQNANVREILPFDLVQLRMQYTLQALETGTTQIYEHQILIEGQQCYEEVRIVPLLQNEVLVMVRDITDRKQAEEELRHQKEMFQTIVSHIPVMIALFDETGHIEFVNPELETVLGWSLEDWQHYDILARCYPDPTYCQSVVEHMLAASGRWQDMVTLTASGQLLETSWANMRLSNGCFLGIGQDISDRKRKEIALQQAMEAAEAANHAKSQFLAKMSHELRTPLNAILGFAQVMNRNPSLPPEFQEPLGIINRSGEHLLALINGVLEMSRIEAGQLVLTERHFNFQRLLRSLQEMFALKAAQKGITLLFEEDASVPTYVCSDEAKLRQILINLISNAIKFTTQGNVIVQIYAEPVSPTKQSCTCYLNAAPPCHGFQLVFVVKDTGCGIDCREWETIFEAFMQTAQGRHAEGTGLGLCISRQFARLMGGDITVQSTVNQGSTFTCRVLLHQPKVANLLEPEVNHLVIGLESGQPACRILVAEDVLENRHLLMILLESIGFEVRAVETGAAAIVQWQTWHPHLILMDIQMSGMDGYEATRQIRQQEVAEQRQPTPIIALTAYAFESDFQNSIQVGCNEHITKPFNETVLLEKIARYTGVRYRYRKPLHRPPRQIEKPLTAQDLRVMPSEWIVQVYEAALDLRDERLRQLIAQIPVREQRLIETLTFLVDNFQWEVIVNLTEP